MPQTTVPLVRMETRYQRALAEEYLGNKGFYSLVGMLEMLEEFKDIMKAKKKFIEIPGKSYKTKDI